MSSSGARSALNTHNCAVPIDYTIDIELNAVIGRATGAIEDDDLLDYARRLFEDPEARKALHELFDVTGADRASKITSDAVRRLAAFWRDAGVGVADGRLAIVAPADLSFGLSRMYQGLRDDGPDSIQVFRNQTQARVWLAEKASP